jgi:hypothetical protein
MGLFPCTPSPCNSGHGVLKFWMFPNILLPDSNVNEPLAMAS